ncbi:MAG: hypothetical protein LUG51_04825, partial [Tannerellaceae bacterium]|nr:hypothetical protein [Tannerellaceae bacterium]
MEKRVDRVDRWEWSEKRKKSMKGKNQIKRHRMWFVVGIIIVLVGVGVLFLNQPKFGRAPRGERLERI